MINNIATSTMFMIMLLSERAFSASEVNSQQHTQSFAEQGARFRKRLIYAVNNSRSNPVQEIEWLCSNNPNARAMINPNQDSREGSQAIDYAAQLGNVEAINALVRNGANVNTRDGDRSCLQPIHNAAWAGNVKTLEALLSAGAKVDASDYGGEQPIHLAAREGHVEMLKALLGFGARVDARNNNGSQPIHDAAFGANRGALELLLHHGANPHARDMLGDTPLHKLLFLWNHRAPLGDSRRAALRVLHVAAADDSMI